MRGSTGKILGLSAPGVALLIGLYMIFGPIYSFETVDTNRNVMAGRASAFEYGSLIMVSWAVVIVLIACGGALGAWLNEPALIWVAVILLLVLTALTMALGFFIAPVALLLLASAVALSLEARARHQQLR